MNILTASMISSFGITVIVVIGLGAADVLPWWAVIAIIAADAVCTAVVLKVRGPLRNSLTQAREPVATTEEPPPTIFEK